MMYNESFEQLLKGKGFTTPVSELQKSYLEILRRTNEQELELTIENITRFSDQLKRLSHVKKPEELLEFNKEILNENISAAIETSQRFVHILMRNLEDLSHLYGSFRDTALHAAKTAGRKVEKSIERAEKIT